MREQRWLVVFCKYRTCGRFLPTVRCRTWWVYSISDDTDSSRDLVLCVNTANAERNRTRGFPALHQQNGRWSKAQVFQVATVSHTKIVYCLQEMIELTEWLVSSSFCRCMLKTSHHAGVESVIIKRIKNQVDFSMTVNLKSHHFLLSIEKILSNPNSPLAQKRQ